MTSFTETTSNIKFNVYKKFDIMFHKEFTPCIDDHHFKEEEEEEMKSVGELSPVCS